jgi:UDP-N-acetylglucosamine--N-acetylmuramyl-(pentapeptide) pyrophosphoryl-undecaprenol N-acetylglucosamine transferase
MQKSRATLGLDEKGKVLVILGGSQGATVLNDWAEKNFPTLAQEGVSLYCVTGLNKGEERVIEAKTSNGGVARATFVSFTDQISELLSAADLVVSRAGAGTIAELVRCHVPAILVPYPFAADNHQQANAHFFEKQGGGMVVDQRFIQDLSKEVLEVIFNDWLIQEFRKNLQRIDEQNPLDLILDDLEEISRTAREGKNARILEMI